MTDLQTAPAPEYAPLREPARNGIAMQTQAPAPSDRRTIEIPNVPFMRLAGYALTGVGLLLLLFFAYLLVFTPISASRNQDSLAHSLIGHPLSVYGLVNGAIPPDGSAVAVIDIPSLHVKQVVISGTSAADLMKGPGLMTGSALPGTLGNSVIAGRRVTFGGPFGAIDTLKRRDRITVVDGAGTFTYRVTRVFTVTAGHADVIGPTTDTRLTLVTSNAGLSTDGRSVVEASLVGTPLVIPGYQATPPTGNTGLAGDPAAGGLALMWSLLTIIVLVGAGYFVWRIKRPFLVYLFAAPIVLVCGLFAAESVARALPATF